MHCEKYNKGIALCPFAFGLALGLASAIAVLIWGIWVLSQGVPPAMAHTAAPANAMDVVIWMGIALLKGFIFGFIIAWIYDRIVCCKSKCQKSSEGECGKGGCGNPNCGCK